MTNYPFITSSPMNELGDDLNQPAPVRKLRIVNFDGDKWCEIELEDGTNCNLKYWNISKPLSYTDVLCSLEDYKMTYASYRCQKCGAQIGYIGRFFQFIRIPLHRCKDT